MPERDQARADQKTEQWTPRSVTGRTIDGDLFAQRDDDVVASHQIDASVFDSFGMGRTAAGEADASQRPILTVSTSPTAGTRVEMDASRLLIGTDSCDLELDDPFVSRWHAQLFFRDGRLHLQDMGSRNGVYLRIADELALEDGDQIMCGSQRLVFRTSWSADDASASPEAVPALGASPTGSAVRVIRYFEGGRVASVHPIGQELSVGRSGCDVSVADDELLGSPHAIITRDKDRYFLCDVAGDSGTFIRVSNPVEIINGDCFIVGRTRIRVSYNG